MASQQKALVNHSGPRFYSQLGKVRASSSTGFQFPRCLIPASISPYRPLSGQHYIPSASNCQAIWRQTSIGSSSILHYRSDGVNGQSPAILESFHEGSSVRIKGEMVSMSGFVGQHYSSRAVVQHYSSRAVVCHSSPSLDMDFLMSISPLHRPASQLHLFTDSSLEGWGQIWTVT